MEEGKCDSRWCNTKSTGTVCGHCYRKPAGSVGTQLLPESQLDRFMICTSLGYPSLENEIAIVKGRQIQDDKAVLQPVINAEQLLYCKKLVEQIYMADDIYRYLCELCQDNTNQSLDRAGSQPRGSVALSVFPKQSHFYMAEIM